MGKTTIEWTDFTFNPWRGCTKVSQGCKHCYAEQMSGRNPAVLGIWGKRGSRPVAAESYWQQPLRWNRDAAAAGERRRVFCASLADVFEGQDTMPADAWAGVEAARARLFDVIERTPWLDWLLLTKRPENIMSTVERIRQHWAVDRLPGFDRGSIWIGTSVEDQAAADARIPHLLQVPAKVRFLSCEPLLGGLDLWPYLGPAADVPAKFNGDPTKAPGYERGIDWVIAGGESGPNARPMHPAWARSLRDQCQAAGVAFHFKQWGEWQPMTTADEASNYPRTPLRDGVNVTWARVGKARAGRLLDGREWNEFPEVQR